jgi:hypothetical protein
MLYARFAKVKNKMMKMSERKQPQGATMNYIFELSSLPCLSLQ